MTISKNHRQELIDNLIDKEYRDAFVSSHIDNGIPFQMRALREQREWTQEELAKISKKKQEVICRLENPNYGSFTLATLKEMASAFDVALMVRFVPFSELVEWDLNLSAESLIVPSFPDESYFQAKEDVPEPNTEQYTPIPEHATPDNVLFVRDNLLKMAQLSANQEAPVAFAVAG